MAKRRGSAFGALLGKKVKVKYSDEGHIRSVSGTVLDLNSFYLVLKRPLKGDQLFINHSVIERIIPVEEFENSEGDGHHIIDGKEKEKMIK